MSSWTNYWSNCKSRISAVARCCFLSRERWRKRCQALKSYVLEIRAELSRYKAETEELARINERLRARVQELECEVEQWKMAPPALEFALGAPAPGQTYPVGLVALCVNLARVIGLRPTVQVLQVIFDWLKVPCQVPCYQSIRNWMQRIGLDRMNRTEQVTDGIWLVDHTNQIGAEKALTILRVRASQLPPLGTPLRHRDMELLLCEPGTQWKREDVLRVYEKVAVEKGQPISILSDGAVELREPAEQLKNQGDSPLVIRDLKHFLSNRFEALLKNDRDYQEFTRQAGQTRSAVQQTELAHFTPPSLKQKARFMNLQPMLAWATMTLWHLDHPDSKARQGIAPERMESKFGWLRQLAPRIEEWRECQRVISEALDVFNKNGVFVGSATAFGRRIVRRIRHASSRKLLNATLTFVRSIEKKLQAGQRLPISTEILESAGHDDSFRPAMVAATVLIRSGASEEDCLLAEPLISESVKRYYDEPDLLFTVATLRLIQQRNDVAIGLFRRVLHLDPEHLLAMNNLAMLLAEQPRSQTEALEIIDRAIALAGPKVELHDTKAMVLLRLNRVDEAVDLLKGITARDSADPRFHFHLALALDEAGMDREARNALEMAKAGGLESMVLTPDERRQLSRLSSLTE